MLYPSYLNLTEKEFQKRIKKAYQFLEKCRVCPRRCGVNRLKNGRGFCQLGSLPMVSSYHPHFGEESCLVGRYGSGTIFFTSCNLSCAYCQNYDISQLRIGQEVSLERLAQMMIELQNMDCHNINLVTPTPQVPQILAGLLLAIEKGLKIPLVYNTNAYDSVETLKLLDNIVDIYLPDAKYSDLPRRPRSFRKRGGVLRGDEIALKYSNAPNYSNIMKKAIKEMHRQVGDLIINSKSQTLNSKQIPNLKFQNPNLKNIPEGVTIRGLLVRHLVLPNNLAGSEKIMEFLTKEISKNTYLNIMDQYRPCYQAARYPELNRRIYLEECQRVISMAKKYGFTRFAE